MVDKEKLKKLGRVVDTEPMARAITPTELRPYDPNYPDGNSAGIVKNGSYGPTFVVGGKSK